MGDTTGTAQSSHDLNQTVPEDHLAIIGFSAHLAGTATDNEKLWTHIREGRSASGPFPANRLQGEKIFHPDPQHGGTCSAQGGYFLARDVDTFDAPFFHLSEYDVAAMDPQQKLLLENVYHAFENAGLSMQSVAASRTSVYVGCSTNDHMDLCNEDREFIIKNKATGTLPSILANRISWFYDLRGTSIVIDTACSSSLVAFHQACVDVQTGNSEMSVVSGVNLIQHPSSMILLSNLGVLSPDGRCYSFDHRANGYARGEGASTVIIKPLSTALRDGNTIRAIIRGTGTNSDGKTAGITLPSEVAQKELIDQVYSRAGLDENDTTYVEAHGTGTPVGDPLEIQAISSAFQTRSRERPLYIGSIKAGLGHLEGGAGLAGLVKAILAIEKRVIPPVANLERVNPALNVDENMIFPKTAIEWPESGIRRVSINSFGFGGTNAHAVIEDADRFQHLCLNTEIGAEESSPQAQSFVFTISSSDENGLQRNATILHDYITNMTPPESRSQQQFLKSLAITLTNRSELNWRSSFVASSIPELCVSLSGNFPKFRSSRGKYSIGFIFTGQGAQWLGMRSGLMKYPAFRESIEAAASYMKGLGSPWDLIDAFQEDGSFPDINHPLQSQSASTALQIALIDLLHSWNIHPSVVIGHSSGEIAAAYCAGKISREAAWKIAYFRGMVSSSVQGSNGGMMAVGISADEALEYIDNLEPGLQGKVKIGCFNSPRNITLTGDREAITSLQQTLDKDQVFNRVLTVQVAYHSAFITPVAEMYRLLLNDVSSGEKLKHPEEVTIVSSVTGQPVGSEVQSADYWVNNLLSPVRFTHAVAALADYNSCPPVQELVEIGPHSTLQSAIRDTVASIEQLKSIRYSHLIARKDTTPTVALQTAGGLHARGYPVDLQAINAATTAFCDPVQILTDLPPYAFNHDQSIRAESRRMKNSRLPPIARHELLGTPDPDWDASEPRWRNFLRTSELPWLRDNKVDETIIFPGVGYSIMAIEATNVLADPARDVIGFRLWRIKMKAALIVPDTRDGIEVILSMHKLDKESSASTTSYSFFVKSHDPTRDAWTEHCSGFVQVQYKLSDAKSDNKSGLAMKRIKEMHGKCTQEANIPRFYKALDNAGFELGPTLRNLRSVKLSSIGNKCVGLMISPDVKEHMPLNYHDPYIIHPSTMESMAHILLHICQSPEAPMGSKFLAYGTDEVWVSAAISRESRRPFQSYGSTEQIALGKWKSDIEVWDDEFDEEVIRMKGVEISLLSAPEKQQPDFSQCYSLTWKPYIGLLTDSEFFHRPSAPIHLQLHAHHDKYQPLCAVYIRKSLEALKEINPATLPFHHQKFIEWMKQMAAELQSGKATYVDRVQLAHLEADEHAFASLRRQVQSASERGKLLLNIGDNIVPIIRGEKDPLEIMFGEEDLMAKTYDEGLPGSIKPLISQYLDTLSSNRSQLNILEIGAGTGSATEHILKALAPNGKDSNGKIGQYHYTDLSVGFFERARNRFSPWSDVLDYKILNIEKDLASQGFEQGVYDVVVATHVLHATADLQQTMSNVRSLLKPGGKLLMIENVQPQLMCTPMAFGTLPGWWNSVEPSRDLNPLITEAEWTQLIEGNGFSKAHLVFKDSEDSRSHEATLFVSTAIQPKEDRAPTPFNEILIIFKDKDGTRDLISRMKAELQRFTTHPVHAVNQHEITGKNLECSFCFIIGEITAKAGTPFDLSTFSEDEYNNLKHILTTCRHLIWLSNDDRDNPKAALSTGLLRNLRWEREIDQVNFLSLKVAQHQDGDVITEACVRLYLHHYDGRQQVEDNGEFLYKDGAFWTNSLSSADGINKFLENRLAPTVETKRLGTGEDRALKAYLKSPGKIGSLVFVDDEESSLPLSSTEVKVLVKATTLSARDAAIIKGDIAEHHLGQEAAGVVQEVGRKVTKVRKGDRVMIVDIYKDQGTVQHFITCDDQFVEKMPRGSNFTDAAAMPMALCTAFYALQYVAHLNDRQRVLVHSAIDAIGQAAIQVAQSVGARVCATVCTTEQRQHLVRAYKMEEDHIFCATDANFESRLHVLFDDGIDLVLNTTDADGLYSILKYITPFSKFLDLVKKDALRQNAFPFSRNVTYTGIDLVEFGRKSGWVTGAFLSRVPQLYDYREIQLSPHPQFGFCEIGAAVSHLKSNVSTGKVVLVPRAEEIVSVMPQEIPWYRFASRASYVMAGGLGGLGRSLARWMRSRGANFFIFLSRSGAQSEAARALVYELEESGCRVRVCKCDISDAGQVMAAMESCKSSMPPIKGCVQSTMNLQDSMFTNMTHEQWTAGIQPKVQGSLNLVKYLPESIDFFLCLSSAAAIGGNRGQANYVAANAFQGALVKQLANKGIPAAAIDLGNMASVGWLAENEGNIPIELPYAYIDEEEFHALVEWHIDSKWKATSSLQTCHSVSGLRPLSDFQRKGQPIPRFLNDPLFTSLQGSIRTDSNHDTPASEIPIRKLLAGSNSLKTAAGHVCDAIVHKLAKLMSFPADEVDVEQGLECYGVDSLVTVDFRTWIVKEMGASISTMDLLSGNSIVQLSGKIAGLSKFVEVKGSG